VAGLGLFHPSRFSLAFQFLFEMNFKTLPPAIRGISQVSASTSGVKNSYVTAAHKWHI
jgi:hypothetical protein